jgi:hypothetical protein
MLEHVHKHITSELQQNTKTDIIFVLSAISLNLISLAVNAALTEQSRKDDTILIVMFLFVTLIIVVNAVAIIGLLKGKQSRNKLLNGLIKMYKDENVDRYYDHSMLGNYNVRYNLFILVVVFTGLIAILIPFIIR